MNMRHKVFAALACILAIAAIVAFLSWPVSLPQQTLLDGTKLTLLGIKTGNRHENPLAPLSQKLAARLPTSFRRRFGLKTPEATSAWRSTNYMTVWLTAETAQPAPASPFRLFISDDHDNFCISDEDSYSRQVTTQVRSNLWLQGLPVLAWPRRSQNLRIRVYPRNGNTLLAEFHVRNPGWDRSTSQWTAPPWPVIVHDGDLDFCLTALWLGVATPYANWKLRPDKNPFQRGTRATFQVTSNGELQTNWYVYQVREICDATGNSSHGDSFNYTNAAGAIMNQFGRLPLPAGEAWRLTAEFSRQSGFAPEELFTIRGVAIPKPNQSWNVTTNLLGTNRVEFRWDPRSNYDTNTCEFWAEVQVRRSHYKLSLLHVTDDKEREVQFHNSGGGENVTHETLKLEPDAASLDLAFAWHPSRIITFQAKPEWCPLQKP
jgi:hypothetical protein